MGIVKTFIILSAWNLAASPTARYITVSLVLMTMFYGLGVWYG